MGKSAKSASDSETSSKINGKNLTDDKNDYKKERRVDKFKHCTGIDESATDIF